MRKIIYISFFLFSFLSAARAQKKVIYEDTSLLQKEETYTAPDETVVMDSGINEVNQLIAEDTKADTVLYQNNLRLPYDSIRNWGNKKEYAYSKYLDSLLKNKKKEVTETKRSASPGFLNSILNSGIVSVLLWAVVISFVLFIIYRLFLADGVFQRRSKSVKDTAGTVEEELITKESNFDGLIRQALQNGNYRLAVRYQYLRTLHLLAGKNFVELSPDKTNFQYVREISNRQYQEDFAGLTLNYEYVWYGEFAIEKNLYQKIETNFTSLNQKL